jgi:O-antigen ligase
MFKICCSWRSFFVIFLKLRLWRTYVAKGVITESFFRLIKITLPLAFVFVCFFGYVLHCQIGIFREFQAALLSVQWMLLVCLVIWCGSFIFLTFSLTDLPLIGLLFVAIIFYCTGYATSVRATDNVILMAVVTIGKGGNYFLRSSCLCESALTEKPEIGQSRLTSASTFLIGLVLPLAYASWRHLDMSHNNYTGPRWMGLWNNPNIYGMLMAVGLLLAIGLLAPNLKPKFQVTRSAESVEKNKVTDWRILSLRIILFIAAGMMAVGLFFSYSRGAWLGAAIALLYLAKLYKSFNWRLVLPGIFIVGAAVCFFWHSTSDTDKWYLKRLDFSRPSAQHRVAAWKAGFKMIRDHPLGVGWNKAVETYEKNYSPPEGGAAAITMNSYLMLGTELGLPALLCFIAYIYLKFKPKAADSLQVACRAGALVSLVSFWFDGGLFDLPTASMFWILLELGTSDLVAKSRYCQRS